MENKERLLDLILKPIPKDCVNNVLYINDSFELFPIWDYQEWGSNINLSDHYNGGGHLKGINKGDVVAKLINDKNNVVVIVVYVITSVNYPSKTVEDLFDIKTLPIGHLKDGREIYDEFMLLAVDSAKHSY